MNPRYDLKYCDDFLRPDTSAPLIKNITPFVKSGFQFKDQKKRHSHPVKILIIKVITS